MKAKSLIILLFLALFSEGSWAQADGELKRQPSMRGGVGVAHTTSNPAFSKMRGLYSLYFSTGIMVIKDKFYVGGLFKNALYTAARVTPGGLPVDGVNTKLKSFDAGLRLAYEIKNESNMWEFFVNSGYGFYQGIYLHCDHDPVPEGSSFAAPFIEPGAAFYMFVEENFGFSLSLSLNLIQYEFDHTALCLEKHISELLPEDANGKMSTLNLGFGFYYRFKKKQ